MCSSSFLYATAASPVPRFSTAIVAIWPSASAAILVGARDPRHPAPVLPGLTPTRRPGIFAEDGGADGPLLATRVGRGWLVVQGPSSSIDAMLLGALHAEGTAIGPTSQR